MDDTSTFAATPLQRTSEEKYNFGAKVTGIDINTISHEHVDRLKAAVWRHKVILVKGQSHLDPKKQWELVTHGTPMRLMVTRGVSNEFYAAPPSPEGVENGITRFHRWHLDAPLYGKNPAWFTTLRCVKLPKGPDLTIEWADGSDLRMKAPPGRTAFFITSQLYGLLSQEEKQLVDHSWVECAPYPYKWIERCKGNSNGLGLAEDVRLMKSLESWMMSQRSASLSLTSRILRPEYILLAPVEEGDMIIWDNYGVFRSAVDYPVKLGPRSMHQANIGGCIAPKGPVPIGSTA
ncbi:hypothetical protein BJY00DRAFT_303103 [Aspergillus carlsbadensis]|nr:hypothetical protein BJY00DRAFT_303103 [Aspergillus carlsbadensis]